MKKKLAAFLIMLMSAVLMHTVSAAPLASAQSASVSQLAKQKKCKKVYGHNSYRQIRFCVPSVKP